MGNFSHYIDSVIFDDEGWRRLFLGVLQKEEGRDTSQDHLRVKTSVVHLL